MRHDIRDTVLKREDWTGGSTLEGFTNRGTIPALPNFLNRAVCTHFNRYKASGIIPQKFGSSLVKSLNQLFWFELWQKIDPENTKIVLNTVKQTLHFSNDGNKIERIGFQSVR